MVVLRFNPGQIMVDSPGALIPPVPVPLVAVDGLTNPVNEIFMIEGVGCVSRNPKPVTGWCPDFQHDSVGRAALPASRVRPRSVFRDQ